MCMVLGTGRRDAREKDDPTEEKRVPYRLASYEHDQEGKRFKSSHVAFSFWSASKYVLILSLMLWWLPMFGQMIAGYVGGRRAGGPWKGVLASIFPVVCLYAIMTGFDSGFFPSHLLGVAIAPAALGSVLTHSVPFISPYLQILIRLCRFIRGRTCRRKPIRHQHLCAHCGICLRGRRPSRAEQEGDRVHLWSGHIKHDRARPRPESICSGDL